MFRTWSPGPELNIMPIRASFRSGVGLSDSAFLSTGATPIWQLHDGHMRVHVLVCVRASLPKQCALRASAVASPAGSPDRGPA